MHIGHKKRKRFCIRKGTGSDLIRVKCNVIRHHLMNDPHQFPGTVPEGSIVVASFGTFFGIKILEGCVILDGIVSGIYQGVA